MIRGTAPLRISLAGGGTDLNYIFEKYGGAVVNFTIDKYCHMSIEKRKDNKIFINNKQQSHILVDKVVEYFKPKFGFNLIYWNDIAPGSGLGNSSSFVCLLLELLNELEGNVLTDINLAEQGYAIERNINEGGWQDQYATCIGGFNFMEFGEKILVYPLRLRYRFLQELSEHLLLVSVGKKENIDTLKNLREYSERNIIELEKTARMKTLAFEMRDCLLNQKINEIGNILNSNWILKRNKFTSNEYLDNIYNIAIKNGAEGGKLCGSGQAGHFLFFVKPENRERLIKSLKLPIVNFNMSKHGVETWRNIYKL